MKHCIQCGKSGLFLKLDENSLCKDCAERAAAEAEAKRQAGLSEARNFIKTFSDHVSAAVKKTVLFPEMGREKLEEIKKECKYIQEHIEDWTQYEYFSDAFNASLQKDRLGLYTSPLFPATLIRDPANFEELFSKLCKQAKEVEAKASSAIRELYDYSREYRIAGVTFSNGRKSRQKILQAIAEEKPPYDGPVKIYLQKTTFEGEDAVEVYANTEQVGYIARHDLPWLLAHWNKIVSVREYDIHGGEDSLSYGMDIKVGFRE